MVHVDQLAHREVRVAESISLRDELTRDSAAVDVPVGHTWFYFSDLDVGSQLPVASEDDYSAVALSG